jgi:alkylation response protein AidB-like acyl-CoA dehydrogenase
MPEADTREPSAEELRDFFDERAAAVDTGTADPRDGLRYLAVHGLLGAPGLRTAFDLIRSVAAADLASAFSLWAHTMVLECLTASSAPELLAHTRRLRQATAWGSSAMAPAIKYVAGLGELPVGYRRVGAELILDGRIPWASNLFDQNVVLVLSARSCDDPAAAPLVLAVDGRDPAVRLGRPQSLLALGATASSSVELPGVRVTAGAVISTDLTGYLRSMKPRLLLLQTAYCLGLAGAATAAGADRVGRAAAAHRAEHAALLEQLTSLGRRAESLVDALDEAGEVGDDIVHVRLRAAQAAQAAVGLELRLAGGAGFRAASPTARRYREAAFLPVQTPTEGQLLAELG